MRPFLFLKRGFYALALVSLLCLVGCSMLQRHSINHRVKSAEYAFQHHVGFSLYDPAKKKYIAGYNDDNYFTPGSNAKIFTFYAALKLLDGRIPALDYVLRGDSLIFWGVGNPTLLHPGFGDAEVLAFLSDRPEDLYFSTANGFEGHFGPGWAWDDYPYGFSTEKSALPLYGNTYTVSKAAGRYPLSISVPYFERFLWVGDSLQEGTQVIRDYASNITAYYPDRNLGAFRKTVPFHTDGMIAASLLQDTLHRAVRVIDEALPRHRETLYSSIAVDSLYKKMMQDSDNFIAEQLLLSSGSRAMDSLSSEGTIAHVLQGHLQDLPDAPVWKDGSGLSRYNLFTPRSIVKLWEKIGREVPEQRLFQLLAVGGKSGTLKNWYKGEVPYIFGKTGTLSNNHCLSGFLITKKGKKLIFSFMNSNYPGSSKAVKEQMERILWEIHWNN